MSWQVVSIYQHRVHTGECGATPIYTVTIELNLS